MSQVVSHVDGSSSELSFDGYGTLTKQVARTLEGSIDVLKFADGHVVEHDFYTTGNKLAFTDKINTDGSHAVVAHQAGQVLEGGSLADTFTDFGATTFVFRHHFGSDTIRGFDALAGADHDVISFIGTTAHSFADLAIEQVGQNTKVMVGALDSVILAGVNAAHVTADDFLFA